MNKPSPQGKLRPGSQTSLRHQADRRSSKSAGAVRRRACPRRACRRRAFSSRQSRRWSAVTSPMMAASRPSGWACMAASTRLGRVAGDDGEQFAFIGDVERVEPEDFARALDLLADGNARLRRDACRRPRFGRFRSGRWSRRRASGSRRTWMSCRVREHRFHQAVERRGVAGDFGLEFEAFAHRHDGDAMRRRWRR